MYVKESVLDSRQLDTKVGIGMKMDKSFCPVCAEFLKCPEI